MTLCASKYVKTSVLLENTLAFSRVLSDKTSDIIKKQAVAYRGCLFLQNFFLKNTKKFAEGVPNGTPQAHTTYDKIYMQNVKSGVVYAKEKGYEMKRVVLAIRNRLVLEAVTNALKRAGFFVEKSSSQETERILTLTNALAATTLVMDVTRSGDGKFDMRMDTVKEIRRQNPEIKIALLCDNVTDESSAYKVKCAKEDGSIDAFFYESVPSDYLADAIDAL